jgi:type VI secretion system protein ImpE
MNSKAESLIRDGQLAEGLAVLQAEIRSNPSDGALRTFLFQLLAIEGQWDRALTQLNVAGDLDAGALLMVQSYRAALRSEALRAEVFAGRRAPMVLGEPDAWMARLIQALSLSAAGRHAEARQLRDEAFEAAPATSGRINGEAFEWIADADPRIGPCLEAILDGGYYWIPFSRLSEIRTEKPADLRDLVWLPADLTLSNGGQIVAFIPTRYAGSEKGDTAIKMARRTEWAGDTDDAVAGLGQRLLATDQGEYALLDVRLVGFDTVVAPDAAAGAPDPQ